MVFLSVLFNRVNLEKHGAVHANYKNYGLVMIDLGDDAILFSVQNLFRNLQVGKNPENS